MWIKEQPVGEDIFSQNEGHVEKKGINTSEVRSSDQMPFDSDCNLHSCFVFQGAAQLTRGNDYVSEQGNIDGGKAAESGRCR